MTKDQVPNTNFSMRANLAQMQKDIIDYWKSIDIANLRGDKETFVLEFGPPFTNGYFHVGHGLTLILKDLFLRYRLISSNKGEKLRIKCITGHDCHGLPIELAVLKEKSKDNNFYTNCIEYSQKWIENHRETFEKIGILQGKDFYTTINHLLTIWNAFNEIKNNGHVYCDIKPVSWCTKLECVVSDAEIEYKDKISKSFSFLLRTNKGFYVAIWTTTPWTLYDNEAVAYNENIEYVQVKYDDRTVVVAKNLSHKLSSQFVSIDRDILKNCLCNHPLENKLVPLLHSKHVTDEDGFGFVHIAPSHGEDDFLVGKEYGLKMQDSVLSNGYFTWGDSIDNWQVIEEKMKANNIFFIGVEDYKHSYPFSVRSKNPIIFLLRKQIFIKLPECKKEDINWFPSTAEHSFYTNLYKRKEWCVSRNRVYGVPLCLFINKDTMEILKSGELDKRIRNQLNIDPTFFLNESCTSILDGIADSKLWQPYLGVLDVWFESGCVQLFNGNKVADLYLEGKDQIRGWFQSSFLVAKLLNKNCPFKNVYCHGFVTFSLKEKMSKSLGNVVSLDEMIKEGIELLRIWVSRSDCYNDVTFDNSLQQEIEQYRKFRNVLRYLISVVETYKVVNTDFDYLEQWCLSEMQECFLQWKEHWEKYEVNLAFNVIRNWTVKLSAQYFNFCKKDLYAGSSRRNSIVLCFRNILIGYLILWTPFLPFSCEEAFLYMKNNNIINFSIKTVHELQTDHFNFSYDKTLINDLWDALFEIRCIIADYLSKGNNKNNLKCEVSVSKNFEVIPNLELTIENMLQCNIEIGIENRIINS